MTPSAHRTSRHLIALRHAARVVVLLFVALIATSLAGCSSHKPAPLGSEPAAAAPSDFPSAGVLRVRLAGLPAGTTGRATVSGPNQFTRNVDGDVDLEVPPGDYTVSAGAATADDGKVLYAPRASATDVKVTADAGALVRVEYERLEEKLKPDVKRVDAALAAALVSVTRTADGGGTLVFSARSPETEALEVGDLLLLPRTMATPQGFTGRVVTTDGITITTSPVGFTDIWERGGVSITTELTGEDLAKFIPGPAGGVNISFCPSLSYGFTASKGPAFGTLQIVGQACFSPTVVFDVWVNSNLSLHAYFRVTSVMSFSVTGEAVAGIEAGGEISIGRWEFPPIDAGPIVVVPEIDVRVRATAAATAGLYAGAVLTTTTDAGFGYDSDKTPDIRSWGNANTTIEPIWPTPFAGVTAQIAAGPQLNLLIDGVAGPFLGVRGVVDFALDPLGTPLWTLQAGLDMVTGIATARWIGKNYTLPVWGFRRTIATSASTPPIGAPTARPRSVGGRLGLAIGADDTIYLASGDKLRAVKKNGEPIWSFAATGGPFGNTMVNVAVGPDGTIYATDADVHVYALNPNGTQKWVANAEQTRGLALGDGVVYTVAFDLQQVNAKLVALSMATGAEAWSLPLPGSNWSLAVGKDGTIYASTDQLHAINPTTKQIVWSGGVAGTSTQGLAIGEDGTLYQVSSEGRVVATNPNGTPKWTSQSAYFSDAYGGISVGPDGRVYTCALDWVRGFSPTGVTTMQYRLPDRRFCKGTPTVGADNRIYVAAEHGLVVLEPSGRVAWTGATVGGADSSPAFLSTKDVVVATETQMGVFYAGTTLPTTNWPRAGATNRTTGRKP